MAVSSLALLLIAVFLLAAPPPGHADLSAGLSAYERGDFETAYLEWKASAEQGEAAAQFNLATLYHKGMGLPQSDADAAWWYRRAAEQGHAEAQLQLAGLHVEGRGVPWDYVQAYAWFELAAAQGNGEAREIRDRLARAMSEEQLAAARRIVDAWQPVATAPVTAPGPSQPAALDPVLVSAIQRRLASLGYDTGPIDGKLGERTIAAIKAFESAVGGEPRGRPRHELLRLLDERLQAQTPARAPASARP